ncbi:hypothetical protein [Pseudomonas phage vB_PsaM_M1]|nr:hypothetical protein [Pseudomonas phage vB_PsaM_M1]
MKIYYDECNKTSIINCGEVQYSVLWPYLGSGLSYLIWHKVGSNMELVDIQRISK